jgi:hypothetical protein
MYFILHQLQINYYKSCRLLVIAPWFLAFDFLLYNFFCKRTTCVVVDVFSVFYDRRFSNLYRDFYILQFACFNHKYVLLISISGWKSAANMESQTHNIIFLRSMEKKLFNRLFLKTNVMIFPCSDFYSVAFAEKMLQIRKFQFSI